MISTVPMQSVDPTLRVLTEPKKLNKISVPRYAGAQCSTTYMYAPASYIRGTAISLRLAFLVIFILLSTPLCPTGVVAMMVLPADLNQLVIDADRIFLGLVTAVNKQYDEHGIPCTYVTVQVTRTLKGNIPTTLTFKQIGGQAHPGGNSLLHIAGLPTYQARQELILFLRPTSAAGFTSPVGMEQGKFTVVRNGVKAQVFNKLGNANVLGLLGKGDDQQILIAPEQGALQEHALDLDSFLSLIEELSNKP